METVVNQDPDEGQTQQYGEAEILSVPQDSAVRIIESTPEVEPSAKRRPRTGLKGNLRRFWAVLALFTYVAGLGSGFMLWGRQMPDSASSLDQTDNGYRDEMEAMAAQINPKEGFEIPATYGDIGPRLVEVGAIDLDQFVKIYQEMGKPLSKEQLAVLTEGSNARIVIHQDNQHFLLNLFWAFGLANQNRVLTEGPMMRNGKEGVVNFASTGGWTLTARPIIELYASNPIISLTEEQQKRLEEVAQGVYRPCCDNPTHFPDCNHGMAMLGLLELMASQGASTNEMFRAAKYVNAFWFPQQTLEVAVAFKAAKNLDFEQADARLVVGQSMSSSSGFQAVHQWLAQNGKLEQVPQGGGSCGVK
jgi:hypothetical protein